MRSACRRVLRASLLVVLITGCAIALVSRDTFTPFGVIAGSRVTEQECPPLEAVWVVVDDVGDCIRYFIAGTRSVNPVAAMYFHGDRLSQSWADPQFRVPRETRAIDVGDASLTTLKAYADQMSQDAGGTAAIFMSRPGVYGSSGSHKDRRRPREVRLVHGAIDAIKRRHRIIALVLGGDGGGGHLVGAMLSRRTDIACGVIGAGMVAVAEQARLLGWPRDITGATDFVDPLAEVDQVRVRDNLRVLVVGDPDDREVPHATQRAYVEALAGRGVKARLIEGRGAGDTRHDLSHTTRTMTSWCARGLTTDEIAAKSRDLSG